jgi:hypothetical protein
MGGRPITLLLLSVAVGSTCGTPTSPTEDRYLPDLSGLWSLALAIPVLDDPGTASSALACGSDVTLTLARVRPPDRGGPDQYTGTFESIRFVCPDSAAAVLGLAGTDFGLVSGGVVTGTSQWEVSCAYELVCSPQVETVDVTFRLGELTLWGEVSDDSLATGWFPTDPVSAEVPRWVFDEAPGIYWGGSWRLERAK